MFFILPCMMYVHTCVYVYVLSEVKWPKEIEVGVGHVWSLSSLLLVRHYREGRRKSSQALLSRCSCAHSVVPLSLSLQRPCVLCAFVSVCLSVCVSLGLQNVYGMYWVPVCIHLVFSMSLSLFVCPSLCVFFGFITSSTNFLPTGLCEEY